MSHAPSADRTGRKPFRYPLSMRFDAHRPEDFSPLPAETSFSDLISHVRDHVLHAWRPNSLSRENFLEGALKTALFDISQLPVTRSGRKIYAAQRRLGSLDAGTMIQLVTYACSESETMEDALDVALELVMSSHIIASNLPLTTFRPRWQSVLTSLLNNSDSLEVVRMLTVDGELHTELVLAALGIDDA